MAPALAMPAGKEITVPLILMNVQPSQTHVTMSSKIATTTMVLLHVPVKEVTESIQIWNA